MTDSQESACFVEHDWFERLIKLRESKDLSRLFSKPVLLSLQAYEAQKVAHLAQAASTPTAAQHVEEEKQANHL